MKVKRSKGKTVISGKNLRVRIKHKHGTTTVAQLAHELKVSRKEAALLERIFDHLTREQKPEPAFDPFDPPPIEKKPKFRVLQPMEYVPARPPERTLSQMEVVKMADNCARLLSEVAHEIKEIDAPKKSLLWRIWDYFWN